MQHLTCTADTIWALQDWLAIRSLSGRGTCNTGEGSSIACHKSPSIKRRMSQMRSANEVRWGGGGAKILGRMRS